MRGVLHQRSGLVDLEQPEIAAACDGHQHALRALHGRLEQGRVDGDLGRLECTSVSTRRADAHQRGARAGHDALDVGEVDVDQARRGDQVGDALHTVEQHLVGAAERIHQRYGGVAHLQQPVIGNDDERVAALPQRRDARFGLIAPALALERERPRHHADRQRAELARDGRDDGRATRAGATAFACGHEHHVCAAQQLLDVVLGVFGGLATHLGVGACAESAGGVAPDVELDVGIAHQQRLRVGVDRDELHALEAVLDHPVDGIDAAATDADHLDDGEVVVRGGHDRPFFARALISDPLRPWLSSVRRTPRANSQPQLKVYSYVKLFCANRTVGRGQALSMQARRRQRQEFPAISGDDYYLTVGKSGLETS